MDTAAVVHTAADQLGSLVVGIQPPYGILKEVGLIRSLMAALAKISYKAKCN